MISPKSITRKDAGDASVTKAIDSYYQEQKDDYYTRDNQPSQWYGSLAADIGLTGHVEKEQFTQMLEGKHNGEVLRNSTFKKKSANDRLGLDLTFNAPKSVSIQALVAGDTRLIEAHHKAVEKSLDMLEEHAQARRKVKGQSRVENTQKLAIAMFRHDTNRNEDPHLHTHSVLLNITKRKDGEYRALHNDKLVKKIPEASQAYQTNLAMECKKLGYDITINENGTFDLAHISREQIKSFSTRSVEIEKILSDKGLTRETATKEQKQMANFVTKQSKKFSDKKVVQNKWSQLAISLGIDKYLTPNQAIKETQYDRANRPVKYGRDGRHHDQRSVTDRHDKPNLAKSKSKQATKNNSLHHLPSSNVANNKNRNTLLLPNNEQFQLHDKRTNTVFGLRRNRLSNSNAATINQIDQQANKKVKQNKWSKLAATFGMGNYLPLNQPKEIEHQSDIKHQNEAPSLEDKKYETLQSHKHDQETLKDMMAYQAPTSELTEKWRDYASSVGMDLEPGKTFNTENKEFSGEKLITHVIEHLADKKVDITKAELTRETLIRGMGAISSDDVGKLIDSEIKKGSIVKAEPTYKLADDKSDDAAKNVFNWKKHMIEHQGLNEELAEKAVKLGIENGHFVPTEERYVTKQELESEKNILRIMEEGRGAKPAFYGDKEASKILDETTLNNGQKSAAHLLMTTKDRVVGIQGYAGTGKSYTLTQVLPLIEKKGGDVHVFAPYGAQVKSLQEDGLDAHTVAKFLNSETMQAEIKENSVIIVDEAGVIPNKDAEKLEQIVEAKNAKLVLIGDTQQTKAISSGKPFDLLQDNNMALATIDDIQRQKEETLKKAVYQAAMDEPKKSVKTLSKSIYEISGTQERLDLLVNQYMDYSTEEREKTLIVTGTNKDKDYINDKVRDELGIKGKGKQVEQLKRLDMSKAESKHARYYKVNSIVEIENQPKTKGLKKNQTYKVVGNDKHLLIVENNQGKHIKFNPSTEKVTAYESKKMEVSKGDKLRVSKGNKDLGTVTGDKLTVTGVTNNTITAVDKKSGNTVVLDAKKKNHIDHDYASTVHSSQGLTVNNVLINIDTKSRTTGKEVYYVAVSRARNNAMVVTDNINKLPGAIAKGATKNSAYQLTQKTKQLEPKTPHQKERKKEALQL